MIRFGLLGEIRLVGDDGSSVDALLRQPKRLALLAYLASPVPGTWHRRDVLLALFWPELDAARARSALRNALYVLRQSLGEAAIVARGDEEVSVASNMLATDLAELWTALREGDVETALTHYRGELLSGVYPADSEGFQRWLEDERTRLRVEVARAGMAWVTMLESEGRLGEALSALRRVNEVNPDDEVAVRRLMELHETLGDRAGGLNVYETFRRRLADAFDATPAPETVALAGRLRQLVPAAPGIPSEARAKTVATVAGSAAPLPAVSEPEPPGRWKTRMLGVAGVTGVLLAVLARVIAHEPQPLAVGPSVPVTSEEGLQIEPAIAPNGRLVAYTKGTALRMRIFVQRLDGGQPWALSGDTSAVELLPRWSPDNDAILFLSGNGAWVSPAVGGPKRLVVPGEAGDGMVRSASWSPDGDSVLIVRRDSLTVRPLDGPGLRFVGKGMQLHSCVWSSGRPWIACASGNWIAFTPGPLFGNRAPSSIVLFPAQGGPPVDLTDKEFEYGSPAWSADGRFLWVLSNRDGISGDVYAIPVGRDGRGGPYVRVGLNAEAIGLSRDRIVYSVPVRTANVWTVPIPTRPPVSLAGAERVTSGNQVIELPQLSSDGSSLIYDSDVRGNADLYRHTMRTGAIERLTDDARPEYAGVLSPDGREIVYHMWIEGDRRIFVRSLAGGDAQPVIDEPGDWGVPRWSPSGSAIVAWSHETEEGVVTVVHRDSAGRWQEPAWRLGNAQLPVWSPDGRSIAFVQLAGGIGIIPADSGDTEILYAPRPASSDPIATFLAWREPDRIWFLGHDPAGRLGVWSLPAAGGAPQLLVDFGDRTSGPALTADGSRLYFTLDQRMSNVRWAELKER